MEALTFFFCWNQNCPRYRVRGEGNIRIRDWYGKEKGIRLLYCVDCKQRFSERRGTVIYNSRLSEEVALAVLGHIADGVGVRQTSRWTHVTPATVRRLRKCLSALADIPVGQLLHD